MLAISLGRTLAFSPYKLLNQRCQTTFQANRKAARSGLNELPNNHREILIAIQKRTYRHCRDGSILQYSQEGGGGHSFSLFLTHSDTTGTDNTRRLCTHIINYKPY